VDLYAALTEEKVRGALTVPKERREAGFEA
jgi:hypothetical protein